jgi:hypothetical protein
MQPISASTVPIHYEFGGKGCIRSILFEGPDYQVRRWDTAKQWNSPGHNTPMFTVLLWDFGMEYWGIRQITCVCPVSYPDSPNPFQRAVTRIADENGVKHLVFFAVGRKSQEMGQTHDRWESSILTVQFCPMYAARERTICIFALSGNSECTGSN